jgi:hypothetical protein
VSWATKRGDEDIAQTLFVPNADVRAAVEGKVLINDDEDEEFSMRSMTMSQKSGLGWI